MGIHKIEKPIFLKEFVWPAKMIHIATDTLGTLTAFPQDAAQASSDPAIKRRVHLWLCLKYSNHLLSVRFTSAVIADRLLPLLRPVLTRMGVLELPQTLLGVAIPATIREVL